MTTSTKNVHQSKRDSSRISDLSQIAQLPRHQKTLLEILIVPGEMSYSQLCQIIMSLPPAYALSQAEIDATLYELLRVGYVSSFMEDGDIIYMIQLKGKRDKRDEQRLWKDLGLGSLYDNFQTSDD